MAKLPGVALIFPGQGSQKPGMGEAWREHPSWAIAQEAAKASNRDIEHLLLQADAEELRQTRNSQLATFVLSMMTLDAVQRAGVQATVVAGHSLGEYSALTAAGALSLDDAVRLVCERGDAMQEAATSRSGTMAAVLGLDDEIVADACQRTDGEVWVANINAPGQVVIAGANEAVDAAGAAAKELGAKRILPVKVSGAFHTPFMAPAGERLASALTGIELSDTTIPVYTNVDAQPHQSGSEWATLLNRQLVNPVLWRQSVQEMSKNGISTFLELGPGSVLTGTIKRTLTETDQRAVNTPDDATAIGSEFGTASAPSDSLDSPAPASEASLSNG